MTGKIRISYFKFDTEKGEDLFRKLKNRLEQGGIRDFEADANMMPCSSR